MSMEGLATIGQRLAEIRSLVADPSLALSGSSSSSSSASGAAFEEVLAEALAADGTTTGGTSGLDTGSSLSGLGLSGSSLLSTLGLSGGSSGVSATSLLAALGLSRVSSVAPAAPTAAAPTTGVLDADGVPADLAAYGNGHIPTSALAPVGTTGSYLWAPAAAALDNLIAAAKADGVTIGVTEGYRSYDEQVELVKSEGLYSQGGLAATPGTSEHGWGMAADLKLDSTALAWMRANAGTFGFVESTPRESWHWSYHPAA